MGIYGHMQPYIHTFICIYELQTCIYTSCSIYWHVYLYLTASICADICVCRCNLSCILARPTSSTRLGESALQSTQVTLVMSKSQCSAIASTSTGLNTVYYLTNIVFDLICQLKRTFETSIRLQCKMRERFGVFCHSLID